VGDPAYVRNLAAMHTPSAAWCRGGQRQRRHGVSTAWSAVSLEAPLRTW